MSVNGACELRGPADAGAMVWCSGAADLVGQFGTHLYSDFAANIQTTFGGKVDYMAEFFDPGAPMRNKVVDNVTIELSIPQPSTNSTLTFQMALTQDIATSLIASGVTQSIPGSAIVGTSTVGSSSLSSFYQAVKIPSPYPSTGRVVGVSFTETSTLGWSCLGYDVFADAHEVEN